MTDDESASGVNIIVVDVEDEDEFWELADEGSELLMGRVVIRDGEPSLDRGADIQLPAGWEPTDE